MNWLFSLLPFLSYLRMGIFGYITLSALIGIAIVLILHFILFSIMVMLLKKKHPHFEYEVRRNGLKSLVYLIIAFLLSIEIVIGWQLEWYIYWLKYIPMWIILIFALIAAVVKARPFRSRYIFLENIREETEAMKEV